MAFYLASVNGLLNSAAPWSMTSVLSSSGSEATVATAFDTAIRACFTNGTLAPYIPTTVEITETSVSTASATFKQTTKTTTTSTTAGTGTDAALPFGACEIITWRTANATRWGRGRWYFPPLGYNALAASGFELLAAAQTALKDGMNAYWTSVGSSYQHVILHKKATKGATRAAYTTDVVVAADIPSTFAQQRRRGDKIIGSRMSITL
jgi:hypothetical protein